MTIYSRQKDSRTINDHGKSDWASRRYPTRFMITNIATNRWLVRLKRTEAWPELTETSRNYSRSCHSLIGFTVSHTACCTYTLCEDESMTTRMKAVRPINHWLMRELDYCCLLTRIGHWIVQRLRANIEELGKRAWLHCVCTAAFCSTIRLQALEE